MSESKFQSELIEDLEYMFPGCIVTKGDSSFTQGITDLIVLTGPTWFSLECKASENESQQPNQAYYVELMNDMSFSRFIYPENKEEVLRELQQAFGVDGPSCVSGPKSTALDPVQRREAGSGISDSSSRSKGNRASRVRDERDSSRSKATKKQ